MEQPMQVLSAIHWRTNCANLALVLQNSLDMPQSENLQKGNRQRHAWSASTSCLLQFLRLGHVQTGSQ